MDAIAVKDGVVTKGQIKTACSHPPSIAFSTIDCGRNRQGYKDVADVFWVYYPENGEIYEVPVKSASKKSMRLRLDTSSTPGKRVRVNNASDFILS